MKIMVFDDNKTNLKAAQAQLGRDHELTIFDSYQEAQQALLASVDWELENKLLTEDGIKNFNPGAESVSEPERNNYFSTKDEIRKKATIYPDFDVVFVDLLVTASEQYMGGEGLNVNREEMPVGVFIGLLAAAKGDAKYVAVFTDSSHHHHPASACFDKFNCGERHPTPFMVNKAKFILCNARAWVCYFDSNDLSKVVDIYSDMPSDVSPSQRAAEYVASGKVTRAKNWKYLLDYLLVN